MKIFGSLLLPFLFALPIYGDDAVDGVCDDSYADFAECTVQNLPNCGDCDRSSPGLIPGSNCEATNAWVASNTNCCVNDECGQDLTDFEMCKACPADAAGDALPDGDEDGVDGFCDDTYADFAECTVQNLGECGSCDRDPPSLAVGVCDEDFNEFMTENTACCTGDECGTHLSEFEACMACATADGTTDAPGTTEVPASTTEDPGTTEVPAGTTDDPGTTEVPAGTTEVPADTTEDPGDTAGDAGEVCDDSYADFVECAVQNLPTCGDCDRSSPGLVVGATCEATNAWITANTDCCESNECGAQLDDFEACKACPPDAAGDLPPDDDATDGFCDDTYADFTECTVQNLGECESCDRASPGLEVGTCGAGFDDWVTFNTDCCTGDECGTQLTEFEACKACSAPDQTTTAPPDTTGAPDDTTDAPDDTTEAPVDTTEAPPDTTDAPPTETSGALSAASVAFSVLCVAVMVVAI